MLRGLKSFFRNLFRKNIQNYAIDLHDGFHNILDKSGYEKLENNSKTFSNYVQFTWKNDCRKLIISLRVLNGYEVFKRYNDSGVSGSTFNLGILIEDKENDSKSIYELPNFDDEIFETDSYEQMTALYPYAAKKICKYLL